MEANHDEVWRVQLGTGEIRMMTLDGLDQAFEEGLLDAQSPVLAPGSSAWTTLGEAAGLDGANHANEGLMDGTPSLSPLSMSAPLPRHVALDEMPELDAPSAEFDLDELALKPRRARGFIIGGVAAAVAVAAVVAGVAGRAGGSNVSADIHAVSAATPPPAAEPIPGDRPAPEAKESKPSLSEEQKQKLLDADKTRAEKVRAKSQERSERANQGAAKGRAPRTGTGLLNGGDKFDPLNGAL